MSCIIIEHRNMEDVFRTFILSIFYYSADVLAKIKLKFEIIIVS